MTNENQPVEIKHECFCQSKWFKKFLTKTLAVFVGTFAALSLFSALHKPPMPPCPFMGGHMMRPAMHCPHYYKFHKFDKYEKRRQGDFQHKRVMKDRIAPDKIKVQVED